MRTIGPLGAVLAALLLVAGCGMFDDHGSRRGAGTGRGTERCDVDIDQWKARVQRFKDKEHRRKEDFRKAKDDLLHDLDRLDTAGCRREVRNQVSDLMDEVRAERF